MYIYIYVYIYIYIFDIFCERNMILQGIESSCEQTKLSILLRLNSVGYLEPKRFATSQRFTRGKSDHFLAKIECTLR